MASCTLSASGESRLSGSVHVNADTRRLRGYLAGATTLSTGSDHPVPGWRVRPDASRAAVSNHAADS